MVANRNDHHRQLQTNVRCSPIEKAIEPEKRHLERLKLYEGVGRIQAHGRIRDVSTLW